MMLLFLDTSVDGLVSGNLHFIGVGSPPET
jgi:hypothetical protein